MIAILISPHDPDVVYHTSNYVHRTTDGGMSWETVSPDLTKDEEEKQAIPGGPVQHDDTGVEVYNTVFALAESPHTAGELWAGTDDGLVHISQLADRFVRDPHEVVHAGMRLSVRVLEVDPQRRRISLTAKDVAQGGSRRDG